MLQIQLVTHISAHKIALSSPSGFVKLWAEYIVCAIKVFHEHALPNEHTS